MTGGESRPLAGRRVVVTRAEAQASTLAAELAARGAEVVAVPIIEIVDPDDGGAALREAAARVSSYDWVLFTSSNAVERMGALLRGAHDLGGAKVAAIGPGTADALARWGISADVVAERAQAEGLLDVLPAGPHCALLPRAAIAREALPKGLRERGWSVDIVEAYRTVPASPPRELLEAAAAAHAIVFTSGSTVRAYLATGAPVPAVVVCIGPITADAARECAIEVTAIARDPTVVSLATAVADALDPAGAR